MKVIVGLGNPGDKYQNSRHNLGFLAVDELLKKYEPLKQTFWEEEKKLKSLVKTVKHDGTTLFLVKPTTFMNLSGEAVEKILSYYKINPEEMVVIYDDLDLPMGKTRIRFGGGAGGHHGVESIITRVGSDKFLRVRLGIGNPTKTDGAKTKAHNYGRVNDHVLGPISPGEQRKAKTMLKQVVKDLELILTHGMDKYMSKYNK